jgi:hypothetical protein
VSWFDFDVVFVRDREAKCKLDTFVRDDRDLLDEEPVSSATLFRPRGRRPHARRKAGAL